MSMIDHASRMPPLSRAGDAGKRRVLGLNMAFLQRDAQPPDDLVRRNPPEIEPLTAGKDRRRELLRLRRRQNEHDIGGRFFQRLEQRVERAPCESMCTSSMIYTR